MNRRILTSLATIALAVLVAVPASAECPNPQCFQSAFTDTGNNTAVVFPPGSATDPATVVGRFWSADNAAGVNTGTCTEEQWLQQWAAPGDLNWYIIGQMGAGTCLNNGLCMPDTSSFFLTVETTSLDLKSAYFGVARAKNTFVVNDPSSACDYDFSRGSPGDIVLVPVPKPRVTSSSATVVDLSFDDVSAAFRSPAADGFTDSGSIVGFKLLEATSATDPGRNPAAYTVRTLIPNSGGPNSAAGVPVNCADTGPNALPKWFATVPVFEGGATDVDGTYAGEAIQVRCASNVANPGTRIKPIEKKKIVPTGEHN